MNALLEADGLSKRFPLSRETALFAVDEVSFVIAPGESVGLVGESGSGKSTLARLLARLLDPSGGRIVFDGQEIGALPARRFARMPQRGKIQMVLQDPTDSLNPRFTACDTIAEPLRLLGGVRNSVQLAARVAEVARQVGLPDDLLGRFPHQLSGGQKARVGIARAIALHPRLLILDEPTSALDVSVQAVILKLLDELRRNLGIGYLFVSHDLNVVRLLCDRILVMYLGKVVESGPTGEVLSSPRHPYTQALVSAIPGTGRERIALSGEPRSPINPDPRVCRFHGRCPKGTEVCQSAMPELSEAAPGHAAACHFV